MSGYILTEVDKATVALARGVRYEESYLPGPDNEYEPINEQCIEYTLKVYQQLKTTGVRAQLDVWRDDFTILITDIETNRVETNDTNKTSNIVQFDFFSEDRSVVVLVLDHRKARGGVYELFCGETPSAEKCCELIINVLQKV